MEGRFKLRLWLSACLVGVGLAVMTAFAVSALSSSRTNAGFALLFTKLLDATARLELEFERDAVTEPEQQARNLASRYRDVLTLIAALRSSAGAEIAAGGLAPLYSAFGVEPAAERARLGIDEDSMPAELRAYWRESDLAGKTVEDNASDYLVLVGSVLMPEAAYAGDRARQISVARHLSELKLFPAISRAVELLEGSARRRIEFALYAIIVCAGFIVISGLFAIDQAILPIYRRMAAEQATLLRERDLARATERDNREFLAMMSHELRTPMNGLLGFADLLIATKLDRQQKEWVETIRNSGQNLLALLNDILDLSRIEMNSLQLESEDLSVAEIVSEVMTLLGPQAASKRLDLSCYIDPALPRRLRGDRGRLRQILVNLLGNAVKFTISGGVAIEVRHEGGDDANGHRLVIVVSDSGIGIPKDQLSRIFDRFAQVDRSSSRRFEGSGLGLSISQELARLMGGEITVESTPDKGSTFSVHILLQAAGSAAPNDADKSQPSFAGLRVLVVDDNALNRRIFRLQLEGAGAEVECVPGAYVALTALARAESVGRPYKVAVIDQMMPEIDGLTLRRMIREKPEYAELKLIISSSGGIGYDQQARVLGFDAACPKPVALDMLAEKIHQLFSPPSKAAAAPAARLPAKPPAPASSDGAPTRQARLLIAEDNPINQRLISTALRQAGFHVDIVGDGVEAVHAAQRSPYDVLLMDIRMPIMNGMEATRRIRALQSEAADMPIIAMTANAMVGDREEYLAAGMNDYVAKPIDFNILLSKIRAHLPAGVGETADIAAGRPEKARG